MNVKKLFVKRQSAAASIAAEEQLSILELVVATLVSRKTGLSELGFAGAVSDIFCRDICVNELREVVDRLVSAEIISPWGCMGSRLLTMKGIAVLDEAHSCILRLLDNNSGLVVASAMMGLFDQVNKES